MCIRDRPIIYKQDLQMYLGFLVMKSLGLIVYQTFRIDIVILKFPAAQKYYADYRASR